MQTKTTYCLASLLMGWGMVAPVSGQGPSFQGQPSLPPLDVILRERTPLVWPDLRAKIARIEDQLPGANSPPSLVP